MRKSLWLSVLCGMLFLAGCESGGVESKDSSEYTLAGMAELNLDDGRDYLYLEFKAEGAPVPGSFARIGDSVFAFDNLGILSISTPQISWSYETNVVVTVYDTAGDFSHTIVEQMPGSFGIEHDEFRPQSFIYQSGNVTFNWTLSAGAEGFLATCVHSDDAATPKGYAEIVNTGIPATTIDADAFQDRTITDKRIIGDYYVYVVAYNPTFFIRPDAKHLKTPKINDIFFGLSEKTPNITVTFGAAVVSQREEFEVVEQF